MTHIRQHSLQMPLSCVHNQPHFRSVFEPAIYQKEAQAFQVVDAVKTDLGGP